LGERGGEGRGRGSKRVDECGKDNAESLEKEATSVERKGRPGKTDIKERLTAVQKGSRWRQERERWQGGRKEKDGRGQEGRK
jgi:hypothetical protein